MILRNLRRVQMPDGPGMAADFTIVDGRQGSVIVSLAEFEAHGEAALMQEAAACARQRRSDGYISPRHDRFSELG